MEDTIRKSGKEIIHIFILLGPFYRAIKSFALEMLKKWILMRPPVL